MSRRKRDRPITWMHLVFNQQALKDAIIV